MTTHIHNPNTSQNPAYYPSTPINLSPSDIGLPAKFSEWRPGQFNAIMETVAAFSAGIRVVAGNLPTGSGKSVLAIATAILNGGRVVVLTSTKGLQDQYMRDFAECGLVDMRGRQNYDCPQHSNCADGRLCGCTHMAPTKAEDYGNDSSSAASDCPHSLARDRFLSARISVTNYACYFANIMHGEGVGEIDLLVLDEAHNAIEELSNALTIVLDYNLIESVRKKVNIPPTPDGGSSIGLWRDWAKKSAPTVKTLFAQVKRDGGGSTWLKMIDNLASTLARIAELPDNWIIDNSKEGQVSFAPLWPTDFAEEKLFRGIKRILLISATIVPKTLDLLGIPKTDSIFVSAVHSFDPRRSPVYLFGACRIDFRTTIPQWAETIGRMDAIINRRLDRKGIIHPVSYDRAEYILSNSQHQGLMIFPKGRMLHDSLELFRNSPPPRILITPAITTGYDFPGSQAEYQFIIKVPFIDARSPILQARSKADDEYLPYLTAQILTQTCGRAMRDPRDQCENFILDRHANWFLKSQDTSGSSRRGGYRHLFPEWFLRQIQYVSSPPFPPTALSTQGVQL